MTRDIRLSVNDVPIELDYFVQGFIEHTTSGMISVLEGMEEMKTLTISLEGDKVTINLNDATVSINPFVNKIIKDTVVGMVSSLKGVKEITSLKIKMSR